MIVEVITLEDAIPEEPVALTQKDVDEGNYFVTGLLSALRVDPENLGDEDKELLKDVALAYAYYRAYLRETVNDAGAYAVKVKRYKELYEQKARLLETRLFNWNIQIFRG